MTIGPQKDEKDDKSPKRWQTLEKMTTDNSENRVFHSSYRNASSSSVDKSKVFLKPAPAVSKT